MIRSTFDVRIAARDSSVKLSGRNEAVSQAAKVFEALQQRLRAGQAITEDDVTDAITLSGVTMEPVNGRAVEVYNTNAVIVPKTEGQAAYIDAIRKNDLTICTGPAGTGKTYIAVAVCVSMLKERHIRRIVLVRPAVEAGEKLGFLPGDMQAKVNPYLRPLFDAMHDMMSFEQAKRFMENDVVEVIPLAFMRGRTLNHSAVILDEAQNTTPAQMLMFLTRLGQHSKMIVTGDASQTDLPDGQTSGVVDALDRLRGIKQVGVVELDRSDIVRHRLVQRIVQAYDNGKANAR
ncbi:MAG: PhoH family protein [Phycisphaerales bacterium]|nr:PhoH family protein [Phycisphaerales bacterium]